ncbi:MAG: hypothetical protein ACK4L8_07835 [Nitrincola lacisaponensis]|uniref:Uncharacterized protein n=1 Tax=Nitrincola lacisaponensis TaxID=267850 RepID=A0A063Y4H3_9GAMM|nr:hypothetical protein [Nitrincola lacisaponensis]KDE40020.1 hypothetical protein ADINL_1657 [Nitrincola lacisaponensis]
MPKLVKLSIALISTGLIGWVMWTYLGVKPISTDLTVIGQGKPVVVLVYESYAPAGMEAMERLNRVRSDYEPDIKFRVAHIGTPEGDLFVRRHEAFDGVMVLFDALGEVVRVTMVPQPVELLREELARIH